MQFSDQGKYEGGFYFGLRHGNFAEYYSGICFTGVYNYGVRKGRGEAIKEDGKVLKGSYVNNKISGPVKFLTEDNVLIEISGCGFGPKESANRLIERDPILSDIEECLIPSLKLTAMEIFNRLCFKSDSEISEINYSDGSVYKG